MKFFIIVFFISCLLLSATITAQSELSGEIKNKKDGTAIEGVNIFIPELQTGTVSDSKGTYSITNLPQSNLRIQFSCIGYKSSIVSVQLSDQNTSLNISLEPSSVEMGEVVVLGNSVNEIEKAPYRVEKISTEKMWKDGFITLQNSLSVLPGVSELSNGISISKPVIRGLFGYRVAAIVNGLRFDNQEWQNEHGFGVDKSGISSVEIIEGPAALLFGANIIGGAVKFVNPPFAPVGRMLGDVNAEIFSNTLGANLSLGLRSSGEHLRWQLHLGGESHADYLAGGDNKIPNTRFGGFSGKGMINYNSDWGFSELDYIFSYHIYGVVEEGELNNPEENEEEHFEREFEGPHHTIGFHIISLNNTFFTGDSRFKLNAGFQNNHREEEEGMEEAAAAEEMGELDIMLNTISYTAEWIYPLFTDAELTIGSQGQFQENENDGNRLLVPDAEMNEISAYSYLKKNYTQFLFEGGVRYDNNTITTTEHGITGSEGYMKAIDRSFSNVNGAFGVSFFPDDNWIFKLNAATGYRAPNLAELSSNGVHEGTTRYEIGNSEMKSEQNFQADAGITYAANCVKFTLSGFNNHVNDFIYLMPTSDSIDENSVHRFTQSDADLRGGEFSTDIKAADWLDINASYSLLIGKKTDDEYLPLMPADKIILNADIELPAAGVFSGNNFHIGLRNYLKQTHTAGNETPTPGYTLLDAGISSTIYWGNVPINLAVNATNILDKVYVNHLSLLKPLGVFDIGRNISLSANVPFTMN